MIAGFAPRLITRLIALFVTMALLAYLLCATSLAAVTAVTAALVVIQSWGVVGLVTRTNRELARFLGAIRYDDFSLSFSIGSLGASFAELERGLEDVMSRFRDARMEKETQRRYLETMVEHMPVAVLSVDERGRVELLNGAARRLLDATAATTLDGLVRFGASFQRDVAQSRSGHRSLTRTELDGVHRHLVLSTVELRVAGARQRLITLQDIQRELDSSELAAWQDMARVLSHEIMSSLTPIASLARTADELVDELRGGASEASESHVDLHAAVHTLARRSESLMRFVHSYRELIQMPPPVLEPVPLPEYLRRMARLFSAEWAGRGVTLRVQLPPEGSSLEADESLLDQALINVLRNAADAALARPQPQVWLTAKLSERGRPVIEVEDNGAGLDEELGDKIFLPFFTTKPAGSGIGLALARQIMLVHNGSITATPRPQGGARFRLTF
jgi:two-component system, NtrC family, nitrogen regulation sensor histidine kinase NtrY